MFDGVVISMTSAEVSVAFGMAPVSTDVRLLALTNIIVVAGVSISSGVTFDGMPTRWASTRACKGLSSSFSALAIGVCQGDCSETVRMDVSRFPAASGSIIVTKRPGGPPPMGNACVVTEVCFVVVAELLVGSGTVSMPGIELLLSLLAVFSTS